MSDPRSPDAGTDRDNAAASPAGQATVPGPIDPPQPQPQPQSDPPPPLVDPGPPVEAPPLVDPVPPVEPAPTIEPVPPVAPRPPSEPATPLEPPPTLDPPPPVDPPPPLVDPVPSQPVTSGSSSPPISPTSDQAVVEPVPPLPQDAPATPAGGPPWKAIAAVLGVILIALIAYLVLTMDDDDDDQAGSGTTTTLASDEFVPVRDDAAGFTVEYPRSWQEIRPAEGEERLLLTVGGESYFQVKVRTVDPATVNQEIQTALAGLKMITEPRQVTLNGLPASLYLYYTPITESSPKEGVHVHYFILKGDKLYSMVFQAMPAEALNDLVPVFDRVAKSFTVIDAPATQETAPTTAASR